MKKQLLILSLTACVGLAVIKPAKAASFKGAIDILKSSGEIGKDTFNLSKKIYSTAVDLEKKWINLQTTMNQIKQGKIKPEDLKKTLTTFLDQSIIMETQLEALFKDALKLLRKFGDKIVKNLKKDAGDKLVASIDKINTIVDKMDQINRVITNQVIPNIKKIPALTPQSAAPVPTPAG